jgi:Phytanoyl-CoA dioxygenase (PhyH)
MASSPASPQPSYRLLPEEQRALAEDGFLLRTGVFAPAELASLCGACEELVADLVKDRKARRHQFGSYVFDHDGLRGVTIKWEGDSDVVHGIEPFAHLSPPLRAFGYDGRLVDPMRDLIGDPWPELFTEKLNLKRPRHGGVNPLHQDFPYWEPVSEDASRIATAMLFLDDASPVNGCLEVLPGSHRRGRWPTRTDGDPFKQHEMDPAACEGFAMQPVEARAGDVLFFGPFLVHQSAPNRSERQRRALLYSYQPAGRPSLLDELRRTWSRPR